MVAVSAQPMSINYSGSCLSGGTPQTPTTNTLVVDHGIGRDDGGGNASDDPSGSPTVCGVGGCKRRRSQSESDDEVRKEIECPVCFETAFPPIRQCPNGHAICDTCSKRCEKCPTCRATPISIRCLGLEKLACRVRWPCIFAGCSKLLKYHDAQTHFASCAHAPAIIIPPTLPYPAPAREPVSPTVTLQYESWDSSPEPDDQQASVQLPR